MRLIMLTLLFCITVQYPAEAQLFKKLKDKVKEVVNDDDESANDTIETDENTDTDEQPTGGFTIPGMGNLDEVPEVYSFDWEYELEITDHKGRADQITYLLNNGDSYFGFTVNDNNSTSHFVYDFVYNAGAMYVNDGNNKTILPIKMPKNIIQNAVVEEVEDLDGTLTKLDPKTILGKLCQGYQYEDDEMISKFWISDRAGISFYNMFANQKGMDVNKNWPTLFKDGLMMEMQYESKTRKKDNMMMKCTRLEQSDLLLKKKDYNPIF